MIDGCGFSLGHYRELLEAALAGGYRFAGFDRPPEPGTIILRHDVDLSLDAALQLAEIEAELGVRSTWCLMTRSVFYNLDSSEGREAIERLRALGGSIAHHAVWPDIDLDERFEPVIAWHNPDLDYVSNPIEGAANVMSPPWLDLSRFRSDSNHTWAYRGETHPCPHAGLRAGEFDWLHLLVHPEIWAFEGSSMRESMETFLDTARARLFEQLRADRIDLS